MGYVGRRRGQWCRWVVCRCGKKMSRGMPIAVIIYASGAAIPTPCSTPRYLPLSLLALRPVQTPVPLLSAPTTTPTPTPTLPPIPTLTPSALALALTLPPTVIPSVHTILTPLPRPLTSPDANSPQHLTSRCLDRSEPIRSSPWREYRSEASSSEAKPKPNPPPPAIRQSRPNLAIGDLPSGDPS